MQVTGQSIAEIKTSTMQAIAKLENQVGQLASQIGERETGKFPSQPINNPKGQFAISNASCSTHEQEQVQFVITLQYGKQVDNEVSMPVEDNLVESDKGENQSQPPNIKESSSSQPTQMDPQISNFIPKAPFPHRLANPKKNTQIGDILEVFK